MDVARFAELFTTEADEHLRLLNHGVLGLESSDSTPSLEQAFRAVHTIKGMAATMGYARVTALAHALEDTLDALRSGTQPVDAATVDELLAATDELQTAIALAPTAMRQSEDERDPRQAPGEGGQDACPPEALRDTPAPVPRRGEESVRHLRVDRARFDEVAESIGELAVLRARLDGRVNGESAELLGRMGALLGELERSITAMRMVSLATVFDRLPRGVRDAARSLGKAVDFGVAGADTEVDRAIAEELLEPLLHLLRNAVDHGLESPAERERAGKPSAGRLAVRAARERGGVRIEVSDDGRGIALERVAVWASRHGLVDGGDAAALAPEDVLRVITHSGFSTAESVTEVSGRGVGMDVVVTRVRALGGTIELATRPGRGTTFTLHLPTTLAAAQMLRVRVGDEYYVIPLTHVREAIELDDVRLAVVGGREREGDAEAPLTACPRWGEAFNRESVRVRDELVPLIRLRRALRLPGAGEECAAVVAELGERAAALAVDELIGREQVLIKTFDAPASALPYFSGATLLADGRPALILDPPSLF